MGLQERQGALVHGAALARTHLEEIKHAGLGALERPVEVLPRMDVGAVLPLHLLQRADGHGAALARTHLEEIKHAGLGALERPVEVLPRMDVGAVLPLHLLQRADGEAVGLRETHLEEIKHAGLGALERPVEVLPRMDVGAVLPLHLLQRADGEAVGLREIGTGTQDVEERVLLAQGREALPQLLVHLDACGGQDLVHHGDALVQVVEVGIALLLVEQLAGEKQGYARGDLELRDVIAPGVHPRGPQVQVDARTLLIGECDDRRPGLVRDLARPDDLGRLRDVIAPGVHPRGPQVQVDARTLLIGECDDRRPGLVRDLARPDDLGRVPGMAARDDQGALAQSLGAHDVELARSVGVGAERGPLALRQGVRGQQVDERPSAGDPEHAVDGALFLENVRNQVVCVHVRPFHTEDVDGALATPTLIFQQCSDGPTSIQYWYEMSMMFYLKRECLRVI